MHFCASIIYSAAAVVLLDGSASAHGAVYQVVDIVYTDTGGRRALIDTINQEAIG